MRIRALAAGFVQLVYVSEFRSGKVFAYPANTQTPPDGPMETIAGLQGPSGLAVDGAGNLYVVEALANDVQVFAPGATMPFRRLMGLPGVAREWNVAVDGAGTVYVTNSGASVAVYRNGATIPSTTLSDPSISSIDDIAVDKAGNVFIAYVANGTTLSVGTFAPIDTLGAGFFIPLSTVDASGLPYKLAIDRNGDLLVSDITPNKANIGVYRPTMQMPAMTLAIPDPSGLDVFALTGPNNLNVFYAPINSGMLYEMTFPGGVREEAINLLAGDQVGDIVVSPAPPVGTW